MQIEISLNNMLFAIKKMKDIPFGTNIQDIAVPDVLKTKVPSGLGYFDYALGGRGFTPSLCGLFTGTPGAGKPCFLQHE